MQSLSELVNMKDQNGNYLKINEGHMKEVLYKNFGEVEGQNILDKWGQAPNFITRLGEFNLRRKDAINGDYEKFLKSKYTIAYSKYYTKVDFDRITYTKIFATQNNLDFLTAIYNKPFTFSPIQIKI